MTESKPTQEPKRRSWSLKTALLPVPLAIGVAFFTSWLERSTGMPEWGGQILIVLLTVPGALWVRAITRSKP